MKIMINMKFEEYSDVRTLVKKGKVKAGEIGTIIEVFDKPCEGYMVEFCNDEDYAPWAIETYDADELEKVK